MEPKRVVVEVTLDRDEDGKFGYHISRPGSPGLGGDGMSFAEMRRSLGEDLADMIRVREAKR